MKVLHVSNAYLDVRAGRCALALKEHGVVSDGLSFRIPPQFRHGYANLVSSPYMDYDELVSRIKASDADIIHVHGELYGFWVALAAREAACGRPVVLDVHDLACAREGTLMDPAEEAGFHAADAYVWTTPHYIDFGAQMGLTAGDKPQVTVTNYVSSSVFVTEKVLPHIGGVCYGGGIAKRGNTVGDRDFSLASDLLGGSLHIYPGAEPPDYGIVHEQEPRYDLYIHRLAQHDWGLGGLPTAANSWAVSMPTKVTEYFAAGIPCILFNIPSCEHFIDAGMAVGIDNIRDLPKIAAVDSKPLRKNVLAQRGQYCVERVIEPLVEMYRGLL